MIIAIIVTFLVASFCNLFADEDRKIDGVYTMCNDVYGFSAETIELSGGKFRYWFATDVATSIQKYPIAGKYQYDGQSVILDGDGIDFKTRKVVSINGRMVLFRDDGFKEWKTSGKFLPYAVLIKTDDKIVGDINAVRRPEISVIQKASQNKP